VFTGVTVHAIHHGHSMDIWFVPFDDITLVLKVRHSLLSHLITKLTRP
jgi:hypothetical protein